MAWADQLPNPSVDALLPVTLEVKSKHNLAGKQQLKNPGEAGMYVIANKRAAAVSVTEEEPDDGEDSADDLRWNGPSRLAELEKDGC